MGIVQMDGVVTSERVERAEFGQMALQQILQRGTDQKRFLAQTQFAAGGVAVIGIQYPVQRIGLPFGLGGGGIIAAYHGLEIDSLFGKRLPLTQCGYPLAVMRGNDEVKGPRPDAFGWNPLAASATVAFHAATGPGGFDTAAETDGIFDVAAFDVPQSAITQPVIGGLHLHAVGGGLFEHAEAVAQAVAERGQFQFGKGVQKAGRQTTKSAVAERGIGLAFQYIAPGDATIRHQGAQARFQTERRQGIAHRAAHQEFHRKVVHAPAWRVLAAHGIGFLGFGPALRQCFSAGFCGQAQRGACVQFACLLGEQLIETGQHRILQGVTGVGIQRGCGVIHGLAGGQFIIVGITPRRRH